MEETFAKKQAKLSALETKIKVELKLIAQYKGDEVNEQGGYVELITAELRRAEEMQKIEAELRQMGERMQQQEQAMRAKEKLLKKSKKHRDE